MTKILFGVALGYIFSDHIDQGIRAIELGMRKANDKTDAASQPTEES